MSEQERLNPADLEVEAALKSLSPAGARVDPVAAAFAAGQRSCQRQLRVWQSAAAALLLVGVGLWFVPVARQPAAAPSDRFDSVVAVQTGESVRPLVTDQSLLMLQAAVAEHGLDGLPRVQLPATEQIWMREAISTRGKP